MLMGRNPFYYRSSFIRTNTSTFVGVLGVAIPSITGLHSYGNNCYHRSAQQSQSLLLQVFIHTYWRDLRRGRLFFVAIPSITGLHSYTKKQRIIELALLGRNPFYYRSSFIPDMLEWGDTGAMSQSLLLQVFIHTCGFALLGADLQVAIPSITGLHSYYKSSKYK